MANFQSLDFHAGVAIEMSRIRLLRTLFPQQDFNVMYPFLN